MRHDPVYRRRRLGLFGALALLVVVIVVPLELGGGGSPAAARPRAARSRPLAVARTRPRPLAVTGTVPSTDQTLVPGSRTFAVRFSVPIRRDSPVPTLSPSLAGQWVRPNAETLAFEADQPLAADQTISVTVPGGPSGIRASRGRLLAAPVSERFEVEDPAVEQVENALARLSYLPFRPLAATSTHLQGSGEAGLTVTSGPGFAWTWRVVPTALAALWAPGQPNEMERGALVAFEHDQGLSSSSSQSQLLAALQRAVAAHHSAPSAYAYVLVSETLPETLSLWQGGRLVLTSLANTGEVGAATPVGTWPVYSRYRSQTMSGEDPDGTPYVYPDVPFVSYFTGNYAVHEFNRSTYGYPQSVGCVELPAGPAATVYNDISYGSLVTVEGPTSPRLSSPSVIHLTGVQTSHVRSTRG
jgi:lipoprotein-anchoring transpeptidase ErfK/SrfK